MQVGCQPTGGNCPGYAHLLACVATTLACDIAALSSHWQHQVLEGRLDIQRSMAWQGAPSGLAWCVHNTHTTTQAAQSLRIVKQRYTEPSPESVVIAGMTDVSLDDDEDYAAGATALVVRRERRIAAALARGTYSAHVKLYHEPQWGLVAAVVFYYDGAQCIGSEGFDDERSARRAALRSV